MPKELLETENALKDLEKRSKASQKDLNEMMAENTPLRMILERNVSALENAIEGMDRLTKAINARIKQAKQKKSRSI